MAVGSRPSHGEQHRSISEDDLYTVLSHRRRRFAVHALKRTDEPEDLGTLAEQIAAWENGVDIEEVTCAQRKRAYTALQQSHLPKMSEANLIEYDEDRGVVEPTPTLENVDVYMDVVADKDVPWSDYYVVLSAVGIAVLAAAWLDLWPFGVLPDIAWAVFVVTTFAVSSLAHRYFTAAMKLGEPETPPEV